MFPHEVVHHKHSKVELSRVNVNQIFAKLTKMALQIEQLFLEICPLEKGIGFRR